MHSFLGKSVTGPCTITSGCVATKSQTLEKLLRENQILGSGTTKGVSLLPRMGYDEPIIAQISGSTYVNAVGLRNPGAEETAQGFSEIEIEDNKALVVQLIGESPKECRQVAEILFPYATAFEINFSCKHTKFGEVIGKDLDLVEKIVREIVSMGKPVLVKPIESNLAEAIRRTERAGASGYTLTNTRGPKAYYFDGYPVLSNKIGGISGKNIHKAAVNAVREARKITRLHITGVGGIATAKDMRDFEEAGANHLGLGTCFAGMDTETLNDYLTALFYDYRHGGNTAEAFLNDKLIMEYEKYAVTENRQLAEDLFVLQFDKGIVAGPGQFVFAWLPDKGEKPFSVYDSVPLKLLVNKRGKCTEAMSKLKKGDTVYIRGSYGEIPDTHGRVLVVGGGTGIAGLNLFTKWYDGTSALFGAKDISHLDLIECKKNYDRLYFATEDGSMGSRGMVTDHLARVIQEVKPDYCLNCGPAAMVYKCIEIERRMGIIDERILSSIEFMTRCGIGLCGECATSQGYRNCVDGTFFVPGML